MTEELKPCPFNNCCKAHSPKVITAVGEAWVICSCGASGKAFSGIDAKEKAIEWWNTRYKRTCHQTNEGDCIKCSECRSFTTTRTVSKRFMPRFCGSCGAEVVDD